MGVDEVQNLPPRLLDSLRYFFAGQWSFQQEKPFPGLLFWSSGRGLAIVPLWASGPNKAVVMDFKVPSRPIPPWAELHVGCRKVHLENILIAPRMLP